MATSGTRDPSKIIWRGGQEIMSDKEKDIKDLYSNGSLVSKSFDEHNYGPKKSIHDVTIWGLKPIIAPSPLADGWYGSPLPIKTLKI